MESWTQYISSRQISYGIWYDTIFCFELNSINLITPKLKSLWNSIISFSSVRWEIRFSSECGWHSHYFYWYKKKPSPIFSFLKNTESILVAFDFSSFFAIRRNMSISKRTLNPLPYFSWLLRSQWKNFPLFVHAVSPRSFFITRRAIVSEVYIAHFVNPLCNNSRIVICSENYITLFGRQIRYF